MFGIGKIFSGIGDLFEGGFDLLKGDFGGFLENLGSAAISPAEALFEADIFFGYDLGDIASFVDDVLDEMPWLKTAIIMAAGAMTGGAGAIIAAAAISAIDTASEINEGTFDIGDIGRGAMEFGANYASIATGGSSALLTTAGQVQMGTQILANSGLLGEDLSNVARVAGAASTANWASFTESVKVSAMALKDTGVLGDDADAIMDAIYMAADGDYTSLRAGVESGIGALRASQVLGEDADKYLGAATVATGQDNWNDPRTGAVTATYIADAVDLLGDEEAEDYLAGAAVAANGDLSSFSAGFTSFADGLERSNALGADNSRYVSAARVVADTDNWDDLSSSARAATFIADQINLTGNEQLEDLAAAGVTAGTGNWSSREGAANTTINTLIRSNTLGNRTGILEAGRNAITPQDAATENLVRTGNDVARQNANL